MGEAVRSLTQKLRMPKINLFTKEFISKDTFKHPPLYPLPSREGASVRVCGFTTAGSSLQLEPEYFGFFHILPADRVCMYVIHLLNEIIFSFNHLRHGGCIVSKKKVQVANLNPPENNKG